MEVVPDLKNLTVEVQGYLRLTDNSSISLKASAIIDDGSMAYVARDAKTVYYVSLAKG